MSVNIKPSQKINQIKIQHCRVKCCVILRGLLTGDWTLKVECTFAIGHKRGQRRRLLNRWAVCQTARQKVNNIMPVAGCAACAKWNCTTRGEIIAVAASAGGGGARARRHQCSVFSYHEWRCYTAIKAISDHGRRCGSLTSPNQTNPLSDKLDSHFQRTAQA